MGTESLVQKDFWGILRATECRAASVDVERKGLLTFIKKLTGVNEFIT